MLIQWYPGHMAKARRMLEDNLKLIDIVAEVVDARAPAASRNPDFDELFSRKRRIVILNKADLASPDITDEWVRGFSSAGIPAFPFVSTDSRGRKKAVAALESASAELVARMRAKGVSKTVRVLVAGIPNVGKSAFINCVAGSSRAKVGDRPGVTKGKQWVSISAYLEMMDSPGILWPKLENEEYALDLAFIGSIKDDIMDTEQLAVKLLEKLLVINSAAVDARYPGVAAAGGDGLLRAVCAARSFMQGGEYDTLRAAQTVLDEFRAGRIARVSLETPEKGR